MIMASEIYIGTERCDYSGDVNVVFSGGDIRDISTGRTDSSYTIELPLTAKNKRLLCYSDKFNVFTEVSDIAYVQINGVVILKGKVIVVDNDLNTATVIIKGSQWYDFFSDLRLKDLDLSAHDHEYSLINTIASWSSGTKHYRYPLINFGRLFSQETGYTANWQGNDFIPAFRIPTILAAIFSPWTLTGNVLTDLAEVFIVGNEPVASTDFIVNKGLEVRANADSNNQASATIPAGGPTTVTFAEAKLVLLNEIADEGADFASNQYTVPESGTYYFAADFRPYWNTAVYFSIISQTLGVKIIRSRSSVETTIKSQSVTYTSTDILNTTYSLNTGWIHCEAGDLIYIKGAMTNRVSNSDGSDHTCTINFKSVTTKLWNTMDERCRYTGVGKTIVCKDWLPDVSQLDFVLALKEAYNLRFTPDIYRQTVYVEAYDNSINENISVIDKVDHIKPVAEFISQNYAKQIRLKFKTDEGDKAVKDYVDINGEAFYKDITLNSLYAKKEIDTRENSLFAWTASGYIEQNNVFSPAVLRIFGGQNFGIFNYPEYRPTGFAPRLIRYAGLTSGFNWYVNSYLRTTYPKATSEDMSVLFPLYFQKTFHAIDRGKIIKIEAQNDVSLIQQFITVVNDVDEEGFRPTYEFTVNGEKYSGYLNKIEFNADKALMELIIKH